MPHPTTTTCGGNAYGIELVVNVETMAYKGRSAAIDAVQYIPHLKKVFDMLYLLLKSNSCKCVIMQLL